MSSNTRKPIQPRPTKASMLRLQKQQDTGPAASQSKPVKTESKPSTSRTKSTVSASDGVKAFMAQQRARMGTKIEKTEEKPKQKKGNFMTGAERYGGGEVQDDKPRMNTRSIQVIIKQAKSLGKLDISSRGLEQIPDEVLNMYHVDPKSIVIDFSSSGDAWYDNVELTQFIAGDNNLTEVDARLGEEFGALKKLDLRDNRLKHLPSNLYLLQNLTSIFLPYNSFESMPTVLSELKQLRELDLSHNQLKGAITVRSNTIEVLDLSYNNISSIDFTGDSNLIKLNLSHNELEELPCAFRDWIRLQELNVSQNRLMYLFPAIGHVQATATLNSLIRLNAGNNSILSLVEGDSTKVILPKLVELVLSTNKLSEAGLAALIHTPQLQTLDISSNQLKDIPKSVMELTQLVRLDVRGNQLRTLSYELGKLDQLKMIYCEGNPMRSFTSMSPTQLIESLKSNYNQQQLQEQEDQQPEDTSIAAGHDALEILSQQLERKVNLTQRLDLSNRKLTELPKQELQFQHDIPGTILLDHNELTLFPHSLCGLSNFIVTLVLDHNRLSNFSLSIEGIVFHQLKTLKLNNNRIKTLECSHHVSFPKLEELSLNHNALTTLSNAMADALPSLRVFSASSNKLDKLTEKPFGPKLEVIDLSNNDISALPSGLSTLSSLRELIVFGNRFRVPRPAIVDQGTGAVLEFLRRRHNTFA